MAEPTSSTAVSVMIAVAASLLPWVNGDVLIGAFGGAVIYAVSSKEDPILVRLIYMVVSAAIGYVGASDVSGLTGASEPISAFILSALLITVTLNVVERVKTINPLTIFKR